MLGEHEPIGAATYQDILDAPEHLVAELIDGVLYTSPPRPYPQGNAAAVLGMDIGGAFHRGRGGPGGWVIQFEPELHLGANVLVPDLAGWRRERFPDPPPGPYFELAPDWACEVLSPSTAVLDRRRKLPIYAREGVGHVWLVDPGLRTVEVYRLDGAQPEGDEQAVVGYRLLVTHAEDERVRIEPFAAIELELGALWIGDSPPG